LEQCSALFDEIEQIAVRLELLGPHLAEQVGGTTDVEALLGGDELCEGRPEGGEERSLAKAEPGVVEATAQERRAELQAGDRLVQVIPGPLGETGVDRLGEVEDPLRDAACRGDNDGHHDLWLKEQ